MADRGLVVRKTFYEGEEEELKQIRMCSMRTCRSMSDLADLADHVADTTSKEASATSPEEFASAQEGLSSEEIPASAGGVPPPPSWPARGPARKWRPASRRPLAGAPNVQLGRSLVVSLDWRYGLSWNDVRPRGPRKYVLRSPNGRNVFVRGMCFSCLFGKCRSLTCWYPHLSLPELEEFVKGLEVADRLALIQQPLPLGPQCGKTSDVIIASLDGSLCMDFAPCPEFAQGHPGLETFGPVKGSMVYLRNVCKHFMEYRHYYPDNDCDGYCKKHGTTCAFDHVPKSEVDEIMAMVASVKANEKKKDPSLI